MARRGIERSLGEWSDLSIGLPICNRGSKYPEPAGVDSTPIEPMTRTIAILSPGDMGSGLGRLLRKHSCQVITNLQGRSQRSRDLAESAGINDLGSDHELLSTAEVIISVLVPSS